MIFEQNGFFEPKKENLIKQRKGSMHSTASVCKFLPAKQSSFEELMPYLEKQDYRICDYTYGVLFMWSGFLNYEYTITENMLIIKSFLENRSAFSIPLGDGDFEKALENLKACCRGRGIPLWFYGVPENGIKRLTEYFGDIFEIEELVDWAEYLYNYSDLLNLPGKKYHGQKNHINKFIKNYPSYIFKEITLEDIPRIKDFFSYYYSVTSKDVELFEIERNMLGMVMASYEKLHMLGGFIEANGRIVAAAIGEIVRDILYIHIEKADRNYEGSYAMINKEFAKHFAIEGVNYINREEDVGDPGLRKAKLSYHPVELIKKYSVKEKDIII